MTRLGDKLFALAVTCLSAADAFAQGRAYEWSWEMHPMWWGWGLAMMLMMLLFWGLIGLGLVLAIRWLIAQAKGTRSDSALEILRQRYARGEINKEEFESKKKDLLES